VLQIMIFLLAACTTSGSSGVYKFLTPLLFLEYTAYLTISPKVSENPRTSGYCKVDIWKMLRIPYASDLLNVEIILSQTTHPRFCDNDVELLLSLELLLQFVSSLPY
jgi:hypothetical protein